jgi:hypothetical protein
MVHLDGKSEAGLIASTDQRMHNNDKLALVESRSALPYGAIRHYDFRYSTIPPCAERLTARDG